MNLRSHFSFNKPNITKKEKMEMLILLNFPSWYPVLNCSIMISHSTTLSSIKIPYNLLKTIRLIHNLLVRVSFKETLDCAQYNLSKTLDKNIRSYLYFFKNLFDADFGVFCEVCKCQAPWLLDVLTIGFGTDRVKVERSLC